MTENVKIFDVTPTLASQWLSKNNKNRKLSNGVLKKYTAMMSDKEWLFTGDSIKFDKSGSCIDGQHRLEAVIRSGTSQKFLVIDQLDADVFYNLDSGKKRTFSDVVSVGNDKKYTVTIAGTVRAVYNYTNGFGAAGKASHGTLHKFYLENGRIDDSIAFIATCSGWTGAYKFLSFPLMSSLHYIFSRIDPTSADDFIARLISGANLSESDPIHKLREKFIAFRYDGVKPKMDKAFMLFIKSWNLYRQNKTSKSLRTNIHAKLPKPI